MPCGENELARAVFERQIDVLRDELAGPCPSTLELHLAERVALCHFRVIVLESLYTTLRERISAGALVEKQLSAAHRRHLETVRTLATVRKLQLRNVQVNIGEKQVNVANLSTG